MFSGTPLLSLMLYLLPVVHDIRFGINCRNGFCDSLRRSPTKLLLHAARAIG
jgi:hypothetical protein